MVAYSKYFHESVKEISCRSLYHTDQTCLEYAVATYAGALSGCCKFVLPLAIVKNISNLSCLEINLTSYFCLDNDC